MRRLWCLGIFPACSSPSSRALGPQGARPRLAARLHLSAAERKRGMRRPTAGTHRVDRTFLYKGVFTMRQGLSVSLLALVVTFGTVVGAQLGRDSIAEVKPLFFS